ncbi:hypothetical protein [Desulfatibacillum aliphaticivorans]|uniref:hypothetical protein n=1 Tax=Desulfatibacillum aliphaticivorans TaxID=218208 RepID=UPI0003FA9E9F|nr:hypothetical protein [Desulfatibacillum aliphaticivorans]
MNNSPKQKAAACARESCQECEIKGELICYASLSDLADFFVLFVQWAIPFFAGMISGGHWSGLAVWAGLCVVFFGYVEAWLLCRHCPAYKEPGATLRCHANWGLPKLPAYNPKPMAPWEQAAWLIYVAVLFLYFVPFFVIGKQWLMLVWNLWAFFTAAWILVRTQCNRCFHLSCPANRVPEDVKQAFYKNFPDHEPK